MRKNIIILLFFLLFKVGITQNLVPNNSFDSLSSCPTDQGQLILAYPWFSPTDSAGIQMSDVFNICSSFYSGVGIPQNGWGYQEPRTGNGYAGESVFASYEQGTEYISVKLRNPLIAGKTYCIGFYVSLSNGDSVTEPNSGSRYAIDCMGAYLSDSAIHLITTNIIPVSPQIKNPRGRFLSDTLNWMLVSGTYQPQLGGEQYITIGNFCPYDSVNYIQISNSHSYATYYYIDDVYVMDCNDTLGVINIINNENNISLYPNPAKDNITIDVSATLNTPVTIEITNIQGQLIKEITTNYKQQTTNLDISGLARGMYFVKVRTEKGVAVKKFIKE